MASSKVLLSSIQTLTFFDGEKTSFRRTSPVDQLVCRGPGCKLFRPDVIQCYNKGGSGTDINWKCEADLPSKLKLGRVEVGCEGWSNSQDPYILKGSCALTYTLKVDSSSSYDASPDGGLTNSAWFFWMIFIAVTVFILYPFLRSLLVRLLPSLDPVLPGSSGGGGGGGGGGGPGPRFWGGGRPSDPPPPYTPRQPPPKTAPDSSNPWRPGFWTGLAAGTAATHLFGNRERRNQAYEPGWASSFGAGPSTGFGTGGWFGGGGGPTLGRSHPTYRGQGSSRDMDESTNLGPIRSSTGFGGTRNR